MNIFFGVLIGAVATAVFYYRGKQEQKLILGYENMRPGQKTFPMTPLWPFIVVGFTFIILLNSTRAGATEMIAAQVGVVLLHISAYYVLLLLVLPLLRRMISARACSALWLASTMLFIFLWDSSNGWAMRPLFVITVPGQFLPMFLYIWACGVAVVLLWQMISHLLLRRSLLANATECEDKAVLLLWRNELTRHGVKAYIPVVISEAIDTPLTIGCFDRTMRLILPRRDYTEGELALIFCHEQRHILRCDAQAKLSLGFSTAMCWFNPLAWVARRKVADDLELSCDEAILADADEATRRQYAELLLKSAGTGRGYTTCLSAAAGTLRYRLRHVLKPGKRIEGGVVVGAAMFALLATFGAAALAGSPNSAQTLIFDQAPPGIVIDRVSVDNWSGAEYYGYGRVHTYDEAALTEYIASLRVRQVYAGRYWEETTQQPQLYVDYAEMQDGEAISFTRFELCEGLIFVNIPYDDLGAITYILEEDIDWAYINSLLDLTAPDPNPAPQPPALFIYLSGPDGVEDIPLTAMGRVLTVSDASGSMIPPYQQLEIGGSSGRTLSQARLEFSYAPLSYTVTVENWLKKESYSLSSAELTDGALPLAPYSAHYTVSGVFHTIKDTSYDMEFYFDIEQP